MSVTNVVIGVLARKLILSKLKSKKVNTEKITEKNIESVLDSVSRENIRKLHPLMMNKAIEFYHRCVNKGINIRIYSTFRSISEQNQLFNRVPKITNARGGESFHNYGLAFDCVEIKNGVALWNNPNWELIGRIGKELGLEWGGYWKSFIDKPHFQLTKGRTTSQLLAEVQKSNKVLGFDFKIV